MGTQQWWLALLAGAMLACMIYFNSQLAHVTTSVWASFVAHGLGAVCALVLWAALLPLRKSPPSPAGIERPPRWAYLGGLPGAFTVILASTTVNSELGLSGTISLMFLGQVVSGLAIDTLGLFGSPRREVGFYAFFEVLLVMTGTAILIFFAR